MRYMDPWSAEKVLYGPLDPALDPWVVGVLGRWSVGSFIKSQWFPLVVLVAGCWRHGYLLATKELIVWSLVCRLMARQIRGIR